MLDCAVCGRLFPEVRGAPTQVCPHCGHEAEGAAGVAVVRADPSADDASMPADPVGAIQMAWRFARADYAFLLLLWLPALALELAIAYGTLAYETARGFAGEPASMTTGEQMEWLGVAVPLSLLLLTVRVGLWTFIAARVLDRALGGDRLARWRSLVGPAFAAGFVLVLTWLAGTLLLLVGLFVFVHWFVYVPAMVANGKHGLGAAFEASRRFSRERRTQGFTALLLLLGGSVYAAWFALGALPGWLGIVIPALVSWALGPIVPLLASAYLALALRAPERTAAEESVAETRSTTRCPRCATLIPYAPDPDGSAIVCPSCGHAGRVL